MHKENQLVYMDKKVKFLIIFIFKCVFVLLIPLSLDQKWLYNSCTCTWQCIGYIILYCT